MTTPALVPLTVAARELGIGRNVAYQLAKEKGELVPGLPVLRVQGLLKVTRSQLDAFVANGVQRTPAEASA